MTSGGIRIIPGKLTEGYDGPKTTHGETLYGYDGLKMIAGKLSQGYSDAELVSGTVLYGLDEAKMTSGRLSYGYDGDLETQYAVDAATAGITVWWTPSSLLTANGVTKVL